MITISENLDTSIRVCMGASIIKTKPSSPFGRSRGFHTAGSIYYSMFKQHTYVVLEVGGSEITSSGTDGTVGPKNGEENEALMLT